ncbi:MAG: cytochrome P450 [Streptosporangiaceae bacterium]
MTALAQLPPGQTVDEDASRWIEEDPFAAYTHYRAALGDPFTLYRPGKPPRVFLSDPATIRELLLSRDRHLEGCGTSLYGKFIGETALPVLVGDEHRRMRQLITPTLVGQALQDRASAIRATAVEQLRLLRGRPAAPLIDVASQIATQIVTPMLFTPSDDATTARIHTALQSAMEAVHQARALRAAQRMTEAGPWMQRFQQHLAELDVVLLQEISRCRATTTATEPTVLARLIASPEHLTDQQIRDQLVTLLIGGANTVGSAIAMALYWVRRLPAVAERLTAELAALPQDASALTVGALPYLGAICDETLRIGSVTPTASARKVTTAFTALGYEFPAGTELIIAIHLAHRREQVFPDSEIFLPERFLGDRPSPTEYLPFGSGTRRCPGAALTDLEMRLILAEMVCTSGLELLGGEIPFQPVSYGASVALPSTVQVRIAG